MKIMKTSLLVFILFSVSLPVRSMAQSLPVPPESGRWVAEGGYKEGGLTAALLIGVGHHAVEKTTHRGWDLECVDDDLAAMQKTLRDKAGFHHITILKDKDATLSRIRGFLTTEFIKSLRGQDNLLLIYYSGHGIVQDSERAWFTYYTDLEGQERYTEILTAQMLMDWVDALKNKAGIDVCLVMDSCATTEKGLFRGTPRKRKLGDERIFATRIGQMAASSAFTRAFVAALGELADREKVRLREIFESVRRTMERDNLAVPEYSAERAESRLLIDKTGLGFTIRAMDMLSPDQALDGARVILDHKEVGRTPHPIKGLSAGRYPFIVEMPGYLKSRATIELSVEKSGGVYEVALLPEYAVIEGTAQNADGSIPRGVQVEVLGNTAGFRRDLHTRSARVSENDGVFRLIVPVGERLSGIELKGLASPRIEEFNLDAMTPDQIALRGKNMIKIYRLDPIVLRGREAVAEADLNLGGKRDIYRYAKELAASGRIDDLKTAASVLVGVREGTKDAQTRDELAVQIRGFLADVFRACMAGERYAKGAALASDYLGLFEDDAFYRDWKTHFDRENISLPLRQRIAEAAKAVGDGDLRSAEEIYAALLERKSELTSFYADQVESNLAVVRQDLFEEAFCEMMTQKMRDDMHGAAKTFALARRLAPSHYRWTMRQLEKEFLPYMDKDAPRIEWISPSGARGDSRDSSYTLELEVTDDIRVEKVRINGRPLQHEGTSDTSRHVSFRVDLDEGENHFEVEAFDRAGNRTRSKATVTWNRTPRMPGFTFLREETFSCGGQTNTVKIYNHEKTDLEFVLVPGGSFMMGSPSGEKGRDNDEGQHRVTVKSFLVCRTECTQAAWDRIGGTDDRRWRGSDLPIENVSWNDVTAWCRKAELRLPTEAEWEYACRAGTETRLYWGDDPSEREIGDYAWYRGNSNSQTHQVGQKKPNAWGLYDMSGNVWEWCSDRYADYDMDKQTDPKGPAGGSFRVSRGGGWCYSSVLCRSAIRLRFSPSYRDSDLGFRLVRTVQ